MLFYSDTVHDNFFVFRYLLKSCEVRTFFRSEEQFQKTYIVQLNRGGSSTAMSLKIMKCQVQRKVFIIV